MSTQLADDCWTMGVSHAWSMKALMDTALTDALKAGKTDMHRWVFNGGLSASIHLLAGNSLEVLLKCACYLHGARKSDLRKYPIRHDLGLLLDEAERLGFKSSVPDLRFIAEGLRHAHFNHVFRYGVKGSVKLPPLEPTHEALTALYTELHLPLMSALARENKGSGK